MQQVSINRWLYLFVLALGIFTISSCKSKNNDAEIQTAIANKTASDPSLAGVTATVSEGTVTLTGSCADETCKTNAENAVKGIDGVKSVVNNIQVAPVQVTDDAPLRTAAEGVASKYTGVQAEVNGGVITLRGTIDDRDKLQQLMQEMNALNPKSVDNQLVIKNQ